MLDKLRIGRITGFIAICYILIFSTEWDFSFIINSNIVRPTVLTFLFLVFLTLFIFKSKLCLTINTSIVIPFLYCSYIGINSAFTPWYNGKINAIIGISVCYLFSMTLAREYKYESIIRGLTISIIIVIFLCLIAYSVNSTYALSDIGFFRFKGIFIHAQRLSLVVILGLIIIMEKRFFLSNQIWWLIIFIILVGVLFLTKTRANTTFAFLIMILIMVRNINIKFIWLFFAIALPIVFITGNDILALGDYLYSRQSDDITELTGRSLLWELLMPEIKNKFWFGHGFGFFKTMPIDVFSWRPTHAHNLWLMQLYETGLFGTILFSMFLLHAWKIAKTHMKNFQFSYLYYTLILIFLASITGLVVGGLVTPLYFVLMTFYFSEANSVQAFLKK